MTAPTSPAPVSPLRRAVERLAEATKPTDLSELRESLALIAMTYRAYEGGDADAESLAKSAKEALQALREPDVKATLGGPEATALREIFEALVVLGKHADAGYKALLHVQKTLDTM